MIDLYLAAHIELLTTVFFTCIALYSCLVMGIELYERQWLGTAVAIVLYSLMIFELWSERRSYKRGHYASYLLYDQETLSVFKVWSRLHPDEFSELQQDYRKGEFVVFHDEIREILECERRDNAT